MAQQEPSSKVPVLVAPREQSVVDASRVTFIWKPVKGAKHYRVQISKESTFDDVLFESKRLDRTEFTLRDGLAEDDDTYYWRILAEDDEGVVHGDDNIESFVSGTAKEADGRIPQPDQDEEYGPIGQLMRGARAEAAVEVTGSPKWVSEEEDLGVEHEGIEAGQILGFVIAIVVAIALAVFTLFQYVDLTAQAVRMEAVGQSGYPELRENRLRALQELTQYDVADPAQNRYQIPIDRAIDLMVQEAQVVDSQYASDEELLGLGE